MSAHRRAPQRLVPSGWRGSASPARPSRTAACRPPAAAARPGRWSPWRRGAPRWPSGSPGWPAEPPAAPAQERPRETADPAGPVITPAPGGGRPEGLHGRGPSLHVQPGAGTGRAPAGTWRRQMGRVEGLPAWDPADPDAPAGSGSELRGSRVAHVRQVCRPRAFTEMLAFAGGARAVSPTPPPPRPDPWSSSQLGRIQKAPEKTVQQQHHSGWGPWLQEAQADSQAHAAVT